jgi:4-amino-4-deoxy-L-arabinose transferase-like glycosyltransferase
LNKVWKILLILLLALILGRFVVVGVPKILFNHVSSDGDESAYLSLGLALRESGVLSDGTRPPLYSLVMLPFAEREWSYFTTAKLVTLSLGVLTVLAVFVAGVYLFGWPAALLAAFLLAANKEFHLRATTVYADTLLALVMIGAWYFLIKSLEGWKYCLLAGIFVGLSFLTKGSAPILLAAWGLMALFHYRLNIFRRIELLLVPLAFIITSLPLLIYNANEFGSPTYNFATQHIMWMDRLEQINTANPEDLPTFSTYLATHSGADMVARVQKGLRRLNPVVAQSVIPGRSFEPGWLGPALGVLAVGVLIYLVIFQRQAAGDYLTRRKNVLWFTFFLCGLFYVFFVWYVAGSSAETRFVIPLLGPLYLILADVIVNLVDGLRRQLALSKNSLNIRFLGKTGLLKVYWLVLALLIGWGVWWLIDTTQAEAWALTVDPYESDRSHNAEAEEIVQWLSHDRPTGEALVAFGPSKSLPLWKFPAHFTFERLPVEIDTWSTLEAYLQTEAPDYLIIDDDTARRRRQALSGYFQRENELVLIEQIPPGWALDFVYPGLPCKWCIFSPVEDSEPLARFEGGIELLSYTVTSQPTDESASQRVILTWRTQASLSNDYTIFVHLTAPDGFVKAQNDRPPFAGALPTSHWRPGEVLADRYDLPLDGGVTPGDYLLLAGLYDPVTGERLKIVGGPVGPAPDSVLLGTVQITGD